MEKSSSRESEIPPDHPTYGVSLTEDAIHEILRDCLPNEIDTFVITQLNHDKSWNNKIYFLNCAIDAPKEQYVLKLAGRPFRPAEIGNEVACLALLQQKCSNIPVPRVIAWSLYGDDICQNVEGHSVTISHTTATECEKSPGWILMTRLPGEALDPSTLAAEDRRRLAMEVSEMIVQWRRDIPKSLYCGNLHLCPSKVTTCLWKHDVHGVLEIGLQETASIGTTEAFWHHRLSWAVQTLSTSDVYTPLREAEYVEDLQHLIDVDLPRVVRGQHRTGIIDSDETQDGDDTMFIFSHTDLSPRNVLVTGSPPQVTGIVDFEYAGFFPSVQEFMGKSVVSIEEDYEGWPVDMYETIVQQVESSGSIAAEQTWTMTRRLMRLEMYIAPWWLSASIPDLRKELDKARFEVFHCLEEIKAWIAGSQ